MNGSEGFLRAIELRDLPTGGKYAAAAIVEFPSCRDTVQLDNLPRGHFPIYPDNCPLKVDVILSDKFHTLSIQRHQLPIQLGFASTAHGAQGKTLSAVGSDLNFGGAKAYVIASRARNREGLALLQPVTLQALNQPPPRDLRIEHERQKALEHNTLIRLGVLKEKLVSIPDPETGLELTDCRGNVKLTWAIEGTLAADPGKVSKSQLKRKLMQEDGTGNSVPCESILSVLQYSN